MPPTRMWRWVVNVASPTNKSRFSSRKSESGRSRFANTFTKVNDIGRRRHCHRLKNHAQLMPPTLNGSRPKLPQTSDHYATISMLSTLSYPNVLHNNTNRCRNFKPVTLEPRLWPCRERKATPSYGSQALSPDAKLRPCHRVFYTNRADRTGGSGTGLSV